MVKLEWGKLVVFFLAVICRLQSGQEEKSFFCSIVIINRKQVSRDVRHVIVLLKIHMPWSLPGVLFYKAYGLTDKMISDLETWTDNFGDKQKPGWLHLSGLFHLHAAYWHLCVCIRKLCFSAPFSAFPRSQSASILMCLGVVHAFNSRLLAATSALKGFATSVACCFSGCLLREWVGCWIQSEALSRISSCPLWGSRACHKT